MRVPLPLLRVAKSTILLFPVLTILIVWLPELGHYFVREARISAAVLSSARQTPSDSVLNEIRGFYLLPLNNRRPEVETAVAERILQGRLEIPDQPPATFNLRFTPTDLETLPVGPRLWFAAFGVPDFLLAAYKNTGREEFFVAARDFLLAWDAYERRAVLPKDPLWNDHATAARVRVLGEFWRLYRNRPDFDPDVGRVVLQQAARYGEFLLSPGHFTFATNHGVMQNIGLLHLSLAFPSLPQSARYRQVAFDRLHEQMPFFIDTAGVIQEHSAGYQAFGLEMLGIAFRSMTLLNVPIPQDWSRKYARGLEFFDQLRRPDATLPAFGDSRASSQTVMPRVSDIDAQGRAGVLHSRARWQPDKETSVHPAAGYWVDWTNLDQWPAAARLQQTVATWSRRPPPAHKHADELSVLVWSRGVSWLTSVGYWPYGTDGRADAESWAASNAPHLVDESGDSQRSAKLVSSGRSASMAGVDLERSGPGPFLARRQVVRVQPDLWVIMDHLRGAAPHKTRSVWTFPPDVNVRRGKVGWYDLKSARSGVSARVAFLTSSGTVLHEYRGSYEPFAGWQVVHFSPEPATAIVVEQPAAESWLAVIVSLAPETTPGVSEPPRLSRDSSAEEWTVALRTNAGPAALKRVGDGFSFTQTHRGRSFTDTLHLAPAQDPTADLRTIRTAYDATASLYPAFQEYGPRRQKVTYLLVLLIIGQELSVFLVRRTVPRWYVSLRVASVVCWLGVAVWLHYSFLRTWVVLTS